MAKINRIRILNFIFDGGNTAIKDEIFSFYEGENALMLQANGGGKTSIIHFIMQVIKPKLVMAKRDIANYFIGNNTAHAMIEWKYGEDEYLLTGICMKKTRLEDKNNPNDKRQDVEYFTYASEYGDSKSHTLETIPIIADEAVVPFAKIRDKLNELKKSNNTLKCFTHNQGKDYKNFLAEYGIFEEEWEMVATINKDEGALMDIFKNSKTTKDVMSNWIISTIEQNIKDDKFEKFTEMVEINAENFSKLKKEQDQIETFKLFKEDLVAIHGEAKLIHDEAARVSHLLAVLRTSYDRLNEELLLANRNLNSTKDKLGENFREIKKLEYMRDSKEYQGQALRLKELENRVQVLKTEVEALEAQLVALDKEEQLLNGQHIYNELEFVANKITQKNTQLENIKKENKEINEELDIVRYSLKVKYQAKLQELKDKLGEENNNLNKVKKAIKDLKAQESAVKTSREKMVTNIAKLNGKIEIFIDYEKEIYAQVTKNTIFITEETLSEKENAERKTDGSHTEMLEKIKLIDINIESLGQKRDQANDDLGKLIVRHNTITNKIKDFEKLTEGLVERMNSFGIEFRPEELEQIKHTLNTKRDSRQSSTNSLHNQISLLDQRISSLQSGNIYVASDVLSVLEDNNIDYDLGTKWLEMQNEADKIDYLALNPYLPYSIILPEKSLKLLGEIDFRNMDMFLPVLIKERLADKSEALDNSLVKISEKGYFIVSCDREILLNEAKLKEYLDALVSEREALREQQKQIKALTYELSEIIYQVASFEGHTQGMVAVYREEKSLATAISSMENLRDKYKNAVINETNIKKQLLEQAEQLKESINKLREEIKLIKKYLPKQEENNGNCQKRDRLDKELIAVNNELRQIEVNLKELDKKERALNEAVRNQRDKTNKQIKLCNNYEGAKGNNILSGSIEELSNIEKALMGSLSNAYNQKDLEEEINIYEADKRYKKDKLNKILQQLKITIENIKSVEPDQLRLDEIYQEKTKHNELLKSARKDHGNEDREMARQGQNLLNLRNRIIETHLKPPSEDTGALNRYTFDNIKQLIKSYQEKNAELQDTINDLETQVSQFEKAVIKIRDSVKLLEISLDKANKIDLPNNIFVADKALKMSEDIIEEYKSRVKDYRERVKGARDAFAVTSQKYDDCIIVGINRFLKSVAKNELYLDYETISEHTRRQLDIVDRKIQTTLEEIQEIDRDKKHIIRLCTQFIDSILEDIKEFDSKSRIDLGDGTKPLMLKLETPYIPDNKAEILNDYITVCIETFIDCKSQDKTQKELRKLLGNMLSAKSMVNAIAPLNTYKLHVYKPKEHTPISSYTLWDDIEGKTSGGELFTGGLFLFMTILSYIRYKKIASRSKDGGKFKKSYRETKAVLMDNPFAKMSSSHLLRAVFGLAKQYNVQMICYTDLKNSSIVNSFKLIYSMHSLYSSDNKRYLVKKLTKSQDGMDDKFSIKEFEQIAMFEMIE